MWYVYAKVPVQFTTVYVRALVQTVQSHVYECMYMWILFSSTYGQHTFSTYCTLVSLPRPPNTQHSTPKAQRPTPNAQRPNGRGVVGCWHWSYYCLCVLCRQVFATFPENYCC